VVTTRYYNANYEDNKNDSGDVQPIHDLILEELESHAVQTRKKKSKKIIKHHLTTQDDQKNLVFYQFSYDPPHLMYSPPQSGCVSLRVDSLGDELPSALTTILEKYHFSE